LWSGIVLRREKGKERRSISVSQISSKRPTVQLRVASQAKPQQMMLARLFQHVGRPLALTVSYERGRTDKLFTRVHIVMCVERFIYGCESVVLQQVMSFTPGRRSSSTAFADSLSRSPLRSGVQHRLPYSSTPLFLQGGR